MPVMVVFPDEVYVLHIKQVINRQKSTIIRTRLQTGFSGLLAAQGCAAICRNGKCEQENTNKSLYLCQCF